jgi:lipoyl(octanoyl) transferase
LAGGIVYVKSVMRWSYLGRVPYARALRLQEHLREAILADPAAETLLLLEHPPVITMGRSADQTHVLVREEERLRRGVELVHTGRGGDVTYHGPGQLVGYPLRAIGRNVRGHVDAIAQALIELLAGFGIRAWWLPEHPGIWCEAGKIGAIGVDARGGVTMHGFALNVRTRLADFQMIVPCGLRAPVTSIEGILGGATAPDVEELARRLGPDLCRRYGGDPVEVAAAQLEELSA